MTKDQAIETCARAMAAIQNPTGPADYWKSVPGIIDAATKLVVSLIALGVIKVSP